MSNKGRVTQLEEALKTVVGDLPSMASTASVAKVENEIAAMAAASSKLQSFPFDGVTDAAGAIAVVVEPALLECTVTPEGPQVAGKAVFPTVVRTEVAGKTSKVVFSFWETATAAVQVTVGQAPASAKPAGSGLKCRFRVTGRVPS